MGNLVSKSNLRNIIKPVVDYLKTIITSVYNSLRDSIAYEKSVLEGEIQDVSDSLVNYANNIDYDSTNHIINLKHDNTVLAYIDATDFILVGMISSVTVEDREIDGEIVKCLVITFNTEGGQDEVDIPLTEIFDADAYYTKTQIDNTFVPKTLTITAGTGLTGGGSLADNITIRLSDATQASLAKADTAVQPVDISYMKVIHTNHFNQSLLLRLIEELIEDGEQDMDPEDYQDLTNFMQQFLSQIPAYNTGLIELSRDSEPTILISVYHNNEEQVFEFRWNTAEEPRIFTTYVGLAYQWDSNFENQLPVQSNSQSSTEIWRLEVDSALSSLSRNPVENRVIKNALDGIDTSIGSISQRITEIWDFIGTTSPNDFNDDFNDDFGSSTILDMIADLQDQDISIGDSIQTIVANIGTINSRLNSINSRITSLENSVNNALANKQDKLTFDTILDELSTNPIENHAVYDQFMTNSDDQEIVDIVRDFSEDYLTFKILSDGIIRWGNSTSIQYSTDGGENWSTLYSSLSVTTGQKVLLKGNNIVVTSYNKGFYNTTCSFDVYGNIMSLVYGDNFKGQTELGSSKFEYLFYVTPVVNARNLVLPAEIVRASAYMYMFNGCSQLEEAPAIPSRALEAQACLGMFEQCINLKKASKILAKEVGASACSNMFAYCSSLTEMGDLVATVLSTGSFQGMFQSCTNLLYGPKKLLATVYPQDSCKNMFAYCNKLIQGPEINDEATEFGNYCFQGMFQNCMALTSGPSVLSAQTLGSSCFQYMFNGCSQLVFSPRIEALTLSTYACYGMFQNCSRLAQITCLATSISATYCTYNWVYGLGSSGVFRKNSSMSSWGSGNSGIPSGWTTVND